MTRTPNAAVSVATGTCRVCHQPVKLAAADGRVLPHPDPAQPLVDCDGADRMPL